MKKRRERKEGGDEKEVSFCIDVYGGLPVYAFPVWTVVLSAWEEMERED